MLSYTKIVGSKGEVVIPKDIRNQQGLKPNSKVEVLSTNNEKAQYNEIRY